MIIVTRFAVYNAAMVPAALGFRVHSGWAAAVAISLDQRSPVAIDRRRIEMADRKKHESLTTGRRNWS
jgi:hypothetical protein